MVLGAVHFQCRRFHQGDRKNEWIGDMCLEARCLYKIFCRESVAAIADVMTRNTTSLKFQVTLPQKEQGVSTGASR